MKEAAHGIVANAIVTPPSAELGLGGGGVIRRGVGGEGLLEISVGRGVRGQEVVFLGDSHELRVLGLAVLDAVLNTKSSVTSTLLDGLARLVAG